MPWRCPRVEADGCRRAAGGPGRASFDFGPKVIKLHGDSRSANAFSIWRRTVTVWRPSFSRSRKRFQSLMISRSFLASIPN
jgi:hypothetical protein